jgi:hypothetical protein
MGSADPMTARGVPCAFASYEVLRGDAWVRTEESIPGKTERIRLIDPPPSQAGLEAKGTRDRGSIDGGI